MLVTAFALSSLAPRVCAQGLGTISGGVSDPSGAVVASAKVTLSEAGTGLSRTAFTTQDGNYVLNSLRPAQYILNVEKTGFSRFTQSGITLEASQSATVNVQLTLGSTSEAVTVSAAADQVDTTTQTLKQVVDSSRMVELPLNGRNAAQLTTLVAGVVIAPNANADQGPTKTFPTANVISSNGTRSNQTSYMLDGMSNMDVMSNINQPFPMPDALQEFSVQTNNYSAEYGQNAGGVVTIVTRSGTNAYHGSGFDFLRNAVLNARNFFAAYRDPLKRNQFGGTFGGPIIKNRTFFFVGYQGTRIRSSQGGLSSFVPTQAELGGDFSAYLSASNPSNPQGRSIVLNDFLNNLPFPGNIIPVSRFDPASINMTKDLPSVGGSGVEFYSKPIIQNFDETTVRLDHAISSKDRLSLRYFYDRYASVPVYQPTNLVSYTDGSTIPSHNLALQEVHIFNAGLLNDFRMGYTRVASQRGPAANAPDIADFGVKNIFQPTIKAIEAFAVSGAFSVGDLAPAKMPRSTFPFADDLRWVRRRHSFAFGGLYERDRLNVDNLFYEEGNFTFSGDYTGLALADFLTGKIRTLRQGFGQRMRNRYNVLNVYAQDTFRATSRLTLNYGLRFEPSFVQHDLLNQAEEFRADLYTAGVHSTVFPNAPAGLLFPGDPGVTQDIVRGDHNNFAPRLGFAYDLTGNGRTSLRGGAGVFYDSRVPAFSNNRETLISPFSPQVVITGPPGPFSNPYQGIVNPFPSTLPPPKNLTFPPPTLVDSWDPGNKNVTPTIYTVNLTIEHQLRSNWLLRSAFVMTRSNHLLDTLELNAAKYIAGSTLSTDQRRPFQGYSTIQQASSGGNSWYHGLQMSLEKRLSHGFTILANYTFSKSLDNMTLRQDAASFGAGGLHVLPAYDPNFKIYDQGPSDFDRRHVFVTSYVWQLSQLAHATRLVRSVAGNWQLSGLVSASTGWPITMESGLDRSQSGIGFDRAQLVSSNVYGGNACSFAPCVNYFNPQAFAQPALGTFGNVGKGRFRAPGTSDWDISASKDFRLTERLTVKFRAEFFNVLNGVRLNNPVTTVSTSGFGGVLSSADPRIAQMALKVAF
jgi:hypothetical protein